MQIIPLIAITAFFVLSALGTVAKLLFDDWRERQAMRLPIRLSREKPVRPPDE